MSAQPLKTPLPSNPPASVSGIVPSSRRKSVLIVDPDARSRALLTHGLSARYDIFEAQDGVEAVALVKLMPAPALIVCEVGLRNVDGFKVARLLKANEKLKLVPLVFLSSRTSPRDIAQGIAAGARRYLFKPFVPETVCTLFTKLIEG